MASAVTGIATTPRRHRLPLLAWFHWFDAYLVAELAPNPRRLRTALRMAVIATLGTGLMTAAHVSSALGPYLVWIMLGPVPMESFATAAHRLLVEAPILALTVPIVAALAETPWLLLPVVAGFTGISTYIDVSRKLGAFGLVLQVLVLDAFYGVIFAPSDFASGVASTFGASAITFPLIALFDTWLWPDPAERQLLDSLAASLGAERARLSHAVAYYLEPAGAPPALSLISAAPEQIALLERAVLEGMLPYRRAVLLASITRVSRINIALQRIIAAALEPVPRLVRTLVSAEIAAVSDALADALAEIARETASVIRTGPDQPPSPAAARVRPALARLDARTLALRPLFLNRVSTAELANYGEVNDALQAIGRLLERPLDEPPQAAPAAGGGPMAAAAPAPADRAQLRYCVKVAASLTLGYILGLFTQRPQLSVILTTVIITALPTYGASLRKMILRLGGTILGGLVSIAAIILVTPNFDTLPVYLITTFTVLFVSAYGSLGSGHSAYAGKSIGTTYLLVVAGLSPSLEIYEPLWRLWGILLGTLVVTIVFFMLWPEYAGDALMPRLTRVLRDMLLLVPREAAAPTPPLPAINQEITHLLAQILEIADDARLEGRNALIDPDAVVQAAGSLRRVSHRFGMIRLARSGPPLPPLEPATEAARAALLAAMGLRLEAWRGFFDNGDVLSDGAAHRRGPASASTALVELLARYIAALEAGGYAQLSTWAVSERVRLFAELQSFRRLEFLLGEMEQHLARVQGTAIPAWPAFSRD